MIENDPNKDNEISKNEIKHLFDIKLNWFEKLIYPIDWVISQFEEDCGLPLTKKILIKLLVFKDAFIGTRFFIDYVNFIRKYSYKYYISYLVACNNHYGKN